MTPSITTYEMLLRLIETEKEAYRKLLGSPGAPRHANDKKISFELFLDNKHTVFFMRLSYTPMDSPIGFPYNRLKCTMTLDGHHITIKRLKELDAQRFQEDSRRIAERTWSTHNG